MVNRPTRPKVQRSFSGEVRVEVLGDSSKNKVYVGLASGKKVLLRLFIQLFILIFRLYKHSKIRLIFAEPFPGSVSICDGGFHVYPSFTAPPAHNESKMGSGAGRESNSVPITNGNARDFSDNPS